MKMLSVEEMDEAREKIASFAISDRKKDEIIRFLDAIAASFVQPAFHKSTVQLSLSARANYAFIGAKTHVNLHKSEISELVDLADNDTGEGAINISGPHAKGARRLAP